MKIVSTRIKFGSGGFATSSQIGAPPAFWQAFFSFGSGFGL
jgi:hypothetical protein